MKNRIVRDIDAACHREHDVIVVGGGIYGVAMAYEASQLGLNALLLERDDFGGQTSWNSLRVLHGGLRYLQQLDLRRFYDSTHERQWFTRHFPALVRPMQCLMPLYGDGLKRPSVFRVATALNNWLSRRRNQDIDPTHHIPNSGVVDREEVKRIFPEVDGDGLRGGGVWWDVWMRSSQRVLIEMLRAACRSGALALNYVEARALNQDADRVSGIVGYDYVSKRQLHFAGRVVVNCAGPWASDLAHTWHRDPVGLFRPALACNFLVNREPLSRAAIAIRNRGGKSPVYFLAPWGQTTFVGTVHVAFDKEKANLEAVHRRCQETMLADINHAIPGIKLQEKDVLRVFSGQLPAKAVGVSEPTKTPVWCDHQQYGGPRGLYSLSGVKYTTARLLAERMLRVIFPDCRRAEDTVEVSDEAWQNDLLDAAAFWSLSQERQFHLIKRLIDDEAVVDIDDLLLRRTEWGILPDQYQQIRGKVQAVMDGLFPSVVPGE